MWPNVVFMKTPWITRFARLLLNIRQPVLKYSRSVRKVNQVVNQGWPCTKSPASGMLSILLNLLNLMPSKDLFFKSGRNTTHAACWTSILGSCLIEMSSRVHHGTTCSKPLLCKKTGPIGRSLKGWIETIHRQSWNPHNHENMIWSIRWLVGGSSRMMKALTRGVGTVSRHCWEINSFRGFSLRPDDGWVHFQVFLGKSTCCYINGHHKQHTTVDRIFNYMFHFGLPEKTSLFKSSKHTFQAPAEPVPERWCFGLF